VFDDYFYVFGEGRNCEAFVKQNVVLKPIRGRLTGSKPSATVGIDQPFG